MRLPFIKILDIYVGILIMSKIHSLHCSHNLHNLEILKKVGTLKNRLLFITVDTKLKFILSQDVKEQNIVKQQTSL